MPSETIRVFVPTGKPAAAVPNVDAARARSAGSAFVIGLLDNHKHNTDKVLERLERRLGESYGNVRFVRARKGDAGKGASAKVIEDLAAECHAVVNGIGD